MHIKLTHFFAICSILLTFVSCRTTEQPVLAPDPSVISYDPPGATTLTKELDLQHKRTIGIQSHGVWVSNEFDGGRLNDFYHVADNRFRAEIYPENAPINRSAWYGFQIWSDRSQEIEIELTYRDGQHRYIPKISHDAYNWIVIDSTRYLHDREAESAVIKISVNEQPLWISAQELFTSEHVNAWLDSLTTLSYVSVNEVGKSKNGRSISRLVINETGDPIAPMIIITGRQHPPEVTGSMGQKAFIEKILSSDPIAIEFRNFYQVVAYPLVNPDGVNNGHWRHNAGGVDLNRDWKDFNQEETRAIRDDLLNLKSMGIEAFYSLDFHSTSYDVFYTINKDIPTSIPGLTDRWLAGIQSKLPDYEIREEPSGVDPAIAKNWMYKTFNQADGVTFEFADTKPRDEIRNLAEAAALSLMEELINIKK